MAHQCLGHTGIDTVHGHVVAVVGRPAQCQFRHIPGSDDHAVFLVGNVHEHLGTLPCLPVFVGDIVVFHVKLDVLKMLGHGFFDIHLLQGTA